MSQSNEKSEISSIRMELHPPYRNLLIKEYDLTIETKREAICELRMRRRKMEKLLIAHNRILSKIGLEQVAFRHLMEKVCNFDSRSSQLEKEDSNISGRPLDVWSDDNNATAAAAAAPTVTAPAAATMGEERDDVKSATTEFGNTMVNLQEKPFPWLLNRQPTFMGPQYKRDTWERAAGILKRNTARFNRKAIIPDSGSSCSDDEID